LPLTLLVLALLVLALSVAVPGSTASNPAVLATIETPANQTLVLTLVGKGVQIYRCTPVAAAPSKFESVLKAPKADLFDMHGQSWLALRRTHLKVRQRWQGSLPSKSQSRFTRWQKHTLAFD